MKELFIIAGPNGAGKTTAAFTLLPDFIGIDEYVNADSLAHALSPFHADAVAIQAGRLMLDRIHDLVRQQKSFAFETTLASKSFVRLVEACKRDGYKTNLVFLWLHSAELAVNRVKLRVEQGGHFIPFETIKRRYERGLFNFLNLYIPLIDEWALYDNSDNSPDLICEQPFNEAINIANAELWNKLKKKYHNDELT